MSRSEASGTAPTDTALDALLAAETDSAKTLEWTRAEAEAIEEAGISAAAERLGMVETELREAAARLEAELAAERSARLAAIAAAAAEAERGLEWARGPGREALVAEVADAVLEGAA
jgi:hypothetical protein